MNRHASMNRIYRLVWSQVRSAWVPVAETARGRGKSGRSRSAPGRNVLAAAISLAVAPLTHAAPAAPPCVAPTCGTSSVSATTHPLGGQVVSGSASITQSGNVTNVRQSSADVSIDWLSFSIGAQASVDFLQPSASAVAVNRILGNNGSQILGRVNANGQVYLISPNGVLFGQGAQVNVGGLVASTLDVSDLALTGNTQSFSGSGTGSVINQGTIAAANGGYVALLGNHVSNQGVITAQLGTVALGAGSAVTLNFSGDRLVHLQVDQSTLNNLAANQHLIEADGGLVIMSAGAQRSLLASVVNNSGVIEARTVENHNGTIELLGGMAAGTANVAGTLDASAPDGGNGGFIETDAAHVEVGNGSRVTTAAATGLTGNWLVDPQDFTIAPSGGDISGATLSSELGTTSVTLLSSSGATAGSGNINVDDTVSWSVHTLTLTAANNVNVNAAMTATGSASLALNPATANGADAAVPGGTVVMGLTGSGFTGMVNFNSSGTLSISGTPYTVINSLGAPGSTTGTDLQGINGNLSGRYALGSDIDATATASWNSGAGFTPIGNLSTPFAGTFDGLGHSISNLSIGELRNYAGLFSHTNSASLIRNVGLQGGDVVGSSDVGELVGLNAGIIKNSFATGQTGCDTEDCGGLVGYNTGTISNSYASGGESSADPGAGGLVGYNSGAINASYATGSVNGGVDIGGLVGTNTSSGTVTNSYSTGNVSGLASVGGLVGGNGGLIVNSYATGSATGSSDIGGLVGGNSGTVNNSYAAGSVSGSYNYAGGLAGNNNGTISNTYATGTISGPSYIGGLVGENGGAISVSYSTGKVTGTTNVGGLVGYTYGSGAVRNSFWNASTSGQATSAGGAPLTAAQMQFASNFTGFVFTTTPGASGNDWVMIDFDGTLNNSVGEGGATLPMLASEYSTTINNAHQLQLIAMNLKGSYTLGLNVNASATGSTTDVWSSYGFVPIPGFNGVFDGLGHTITGLTIDQTFENYVGLFGSTVFPSLIQNVGLIRGSVTGVNYVGALVGFNAAGGVINNSYATTSVSGNTGVGGLVGVNTSLVTNSYYAGSVTGQSEVGGLLGGNFHGGTISNSYSTGAVSGGNYVGGLVGESSNGTINDTYAAGPVRGSSNVGGLSGFGNGVASNSFWNITTSGQAISAAGTGLTTAQMQTASNFTGFGFTSITGSSGNNWVIVDTDGTLNNASSATGATYPMLASEYSTTINNAHQLQLMAMNTAASYTLGQNIDASATGNGLGVWGNSGFAPIGGSITSFTGTFDGLAHTISGLTINLPAANDIGLFGFIGSGSAIQNVGLIGGSVIGLGSVGELVGYSAGSIGNSYTTGTVSGTNSVGGLVGVNASDVSNSYATGSVTGTNSIGGLAGVNLALISTSYATGNVNGSTDVGGLVGQNPNVITSSYASGTVNGVTEVGGLVGNGGGGSINYSYATGAVTGSQSVGGLLGYGNGNSISNSHASGAVNGSNYVGGLVGSNLSSSLITNSYATGSVSGNSVVGGLVGINTSSIITGSYATGGAFAEDGITGGLVGVNSGTVSNSYATTSGDGPESFAGGLVGKNYGSISSSFATGSVGVGGNSVGGLVGKNYGSGSVINSYATGSVSGSSALGGLVGVNAGTISNSYATGNVGNGVGDNGGLVGYNAGGSINSSYSTGAVQAGGGNGGLVGANSGGVVSNSFWDVTTSGQASSAGGIGMTTANMQNQVNFTTATAANGNVNPNWDFTSTWVMYSGNTYPLLRSFMTPLTVTANSGSMTYNGSAYNGANGVTYSVTPNGNLFGTLSFSSASGPAVNVGTYTITPSGLYSNQQGYIISYGSGNLNINQLASVAWVGGATGNWSTASNWAGGAIPDYSNVAAVTIPKGDTVTYDTGMAALGTTKLTTLTDSGNLVMAAGTLDTTGNLSTTGFAQSGGTLDVGGSFTIESTGGVVTLGNITAGTLNVTSQAGAIKQLAATALDVTGTSDFTADNGVSGAGDIKYNITLDNAGNKFVGAVTSDASNIGVVDSLAGLILGNTTATATLTDTSQGGALTQAAGSAVTVTGTSILQAFNGATKYAVTFGQAGDSFGGAVTAEGSGITLDDKTALTAILDSSGPATLTAAGAMNISGTVGTKLTTTTTGAKHATTFGKTTVGKSLVVTSTGAVTETSSNVLTVAGKGTTTVSNPNVKVNGVKGAKIPAP